MEPATPDRKRGIAVLSRAAVLPLCASLALASWLLAPCAVVAAPAADPPASDSARDEPDEGLDPCTADGAGQPGAPDPADPAAEPDAAGPPPADGAAGAGEPGSAEDPGPVRVKRVVEALDEGHAVQVRMLCDFVHRIDRIFGEAYVEDRERKVSLRVGAGGTLNEDGVGTDLSLSVAGRIPLPALERRINLFLDIGGSLEDSGASPGAVLEDPERSLSLGTTLLGRRRGDIEPGLKLKGVWNDGPDLEVIPLLRLERQHGAARTFFEQRVLWNPGDSWGLQSSLDHDVRISPAVVLRISNRLRHRFGDTGAALAHGLAMRRQFSPRAGLSLEAWLEHSTALEDPSDIDDDTIAYALLRWRSRFFRDWLEYEVRPEFSLPLVEGRNPFVSLFLSLTVVWDDYLGGAAGPPKR